MRSTQAWMWPGKGGSGHEGNIEAQGLAVVLLSLERMKVAK